MTKNINEIIKEITSWKKEHPTYYFYEVKSIATKLQLIVEAIDNNGPDKFFIIPMYALSNGNCSNDQFRVFKRYLDANEELRNAKEELIKLFTSEIN